MPIQLFELTLFLCPKNSFIVVLRHSGGNSNKDPPVPIPNTEVKLVSAEDIIILRKIQVVFYRFLKKVLMGRVVERSPRVHVY